jgi:predicted chitinase
MATGAQTCTALLAHQAQRQPDDALRALGAALAPELLKAGILDTRARLAEALAETGNETGGYTRFAENMSYSAAGMMRTWPARFPRWRARKPSSASRASWPTSSMAAAWATSSTARMTMMAGTVEAAA